MTHTVILKTSRDRERLCTLAARAPAGYVATVKEPVRTNDQNALLWALLTDISTAKPEGRCMIPEQWKCVFMAACGWEQQFLMGLDGQPFPAGFRSSKMTKSQMGDLITFIQEYGDRHGVRWSDGVTV